MNVLAVRLEESLPKRPTNAGMPKQILRTVIFANTGNRMSLRKFCARVNISYQGCIEQIGRKPNVPFMQIVAEMRARAKRRAVKRTHPDCPYCQCGAPFRTPIDGDQLANPEILDHDPIPTGTPAAEPGVP